MHVGDRRTKAPRLHVLINWLTRFQLRGLGRNRLILYVQWIFFTEEWKGPRKTLMHPYTYIFTFFAVAPTLFFFFFTLWVLYFLKEPITIFQVESRGRIKAAERSSSQTNGSDPLSSPITTELSETKSFLQSSAYALAAEIRPKAGFLKFFSLVKCSFM